MQQIIQFFYNHQDVISIVSGIITIISAFGAGISLMHYKGISFINCLFEVRVSKRCSQSESNHRDIVIITNKLKTDTEAPRKEEQARNQDKWGYGPTIYNHTIEKKINSDEFNKKLDDIVSNAVDKKISDTIFNSDEFYTQFFKHIEEKNQSNRLNLGDIVQSGSANKTTVIQDNSVNKRDYNVALICFFSFLSVSVIFGVLYAITLLLKG